MTERIPLQSLATQTLIDVSADNVTYVPIDGDQEIKEGTAAVLVFSNSRLSIENPFVFRSSQRTSLQDFIGAVVVDAYSTDTELCVAFADGDQISISLRDSDFTGPEAAVYAPEHGPIVVFN